MISLCFHVLTSTLLYIVLLKFYKISYNLMPSTPRIIPLKIACYLTSLCFCIHPVNIEVVGKQLLFLYESICHLFIILSNERMDECMISLSFYLSRVDQCWKL